jgi:Sulfotransferase family
MPPLSAEAPPVAQEPLGRTFLLGFYRGGTTFVQRLLNCHRRVTIWGENGGFVSRLRQMHERFARDAQFVDSRDFTDFDGFADKFVPYANPVDSDELVRHMATFLETMYWPGRQPTMWGFKEIRNSNQADIAFLRLLFPNAKLVLLIRHPRDLLHSDLHSQWSPAELGHFSGYVDRFIVRYFRTCRAFSDAVDRFPADARICAYEEFCDRGFYPELCDWLGLRDSEMDHRLVETVREMRTGSSHGANGRPVPDREAEHAMSYFRERLASMLSQETTARESRLIERFYPDVR